MWFAGGRLAAAAAVSEGLVWRVGCWRAAPGWRRCTGAVSVRRRCLGPRVACPAGVANGGLGCLWVTFLGWLVLWSLVVPGSPGVRGKLGCGKPAGCPQGVSGGLGCFGLGFSTGVGGSGPDPFRALASPCFMHKRCYASFCGCLATHDCFLVRAWLHPCRPRVVGPRPAVPPRPLDRTPVRGGGRRDVRRMPVRITPLPRKPSARTTPLPRASTKGHEHPHNNHSP